MGNRRGFIIKGAMCCSFLSNKVIGIYCYHYENIVFPFGVEPLYIQAKVVLVRVGS